MVIGTLSSFINQDTVDISTVASTQYYSYPLATVGVDSATVLIGSVRYTLTPIYSQETWNFCNALQIQPTAIPQFIFPRKDDFGIWPIPTAVYTVELNRFFRDRNLLIDDYTDGTIALTAGDETVTGTNTTFTSAMVGRYLAVTSLTNPGQGYFYRVATYTDATHLELEIPWDSATATGLSYRIGETPLIPDEGHIMLVDGATADFYAGLRNAKDSAVFFENRFWTGDGNNPIRDLSSKNVAGGLIGMIRKYADRERDNIVYRNPGIMSPTYKIWSESIS